MPTSQEHKSRALKMVGLPHPGPIHKDDLNNRIAMASRLAAFMERIEQPWPSGVEIPSPTKFQMPEIRKSRPLA